VKGSPRALTAESRANPALLLGRRVRVIEFAVMKWLVLVAGACLVFGCSSSGDDDDDDAFEGEPLECAWFTEQNCWISTFAGAPSCVPPSSETGVLSADGRSCTYTNGSSVVFRQPLVFPNLDDADEDNDFIESWNFTVKASDGSDCIRYEESDSGKQVVVRGQAYTELYRGFGMQVTCPDGKKYATPNAFDLLECDDYFSNAPSSAYAYSGSSISFSFGGLGSASVEAFSCAR